MGIKDKYKLIQNFNRKVISLIPAEKLVSPIASTSIPAEKASITLDMKSFTEQVKPVQTCQITYTIPMDCVERVSKYMQNVLSNYHKDRFGNLIRNTRKNFK